MQIVNPKRNGSDHTSTAGWYPYYAGFSGEFASCILKTARSEENYWVLDPWNGSGTTSAQAAIQGVRCIGVDLNPAMAVVAKARALSRTEYPSLEPLTDSLLDSVRFGHYEGEDPLRIWFGPRAVSSLRSIEAAIVRLLVGSKANLAVRDYVEGMSNTASFFYLALFRTCRSLLKVHFSSNPTWLKKPKTDEERLQLTHNEVLATFQRELRKILPSSPFKISCISSAESRIQVGNSEDLMLADHSVDLVISSPPYCTRIDYAVSTAAELAVLGVGEESKELRQQMMGTSTVPKNLPACDERWGGTCNTFLKDVLTHPSKASATYYYKNHVQYFTSLFKSLNEVRRVLKPDGTCYLVVQDSYYKDVHNNLAAIIREMAETIGFGSTCQTDFQVSRTLAGVHPGARSYRSEFAATESVLMLSGA